MSELNPKRILGIDVGVRNIITIGNNISEKGIAVKGGVLKSINQHFNKKLAKLKYKEIPIDFRSLQSIFPIYISE